jgi:hypothetical protein
MCTFIIFWWIRELSNTTLIGRVAIGGRALCALVLHSTGPDSYLALIAYAPWHLEVESCVYLYYILLDQTVIQHYFDWSHDI